MGAKHLNIAHQSKAFYVVLTLFVLAIIFVAMQSTLSVELSSKLSVGVLEFLKPLFQPLLGRRFDEVFVRKVAHMIEFFGLGLFMSLLCLLMRSKRDKTSKSLRIGKWAASRIIKRCTLAFAVCLVLSFTDEGIQFLNDRTPQWHDVLVNAFSAFVVILIVMLVALILNKSLKPTRKN